MTDLDAPAAKRRLRRQIRRAIDAKDFDARRVEEARLRDRLASLPEFQNAPSVLLYVSVFADEIDTSPLLRAVLDSGRRLILPRVDRDAWRLSLHEVQDLETDLVVGRMDLREPRADAPEVPPGEVAFVVVPGVAFDAAGYRVGRGGGLYDRFLPTLAPQTPLWALALPEQVVPGVPVEPHDVPLWGIILPDRRIGPIAPKSPARERLFD